MDTVTITLGGKDYPVPPLTLGQIKIVVPAAQRLTSMKVDALLEADISDLTTMAYTAIFKATPMSRPAFEDLHITVDDLVSAYAVIAKQAGMVEKKPEAAATGNPSIGTTS
ncbi:MAG: hypothetical protein J0H19_18710 [Rhodospirillales bacterium]|nr:hypothetical protein [Rhodospirillales bacterium]